MREPTSQENRVGLLAEAMAHEMYNEGMTRFLVTAKIYAAALIASEQALEIVERHLALHTQVHDHGDGRQYSDCEECSRGHAEAEAWAALALVRALPGLKVED